MTYRSNTHAWFQRERVGNQLCLIRIGRVLSRRNPIIVLLGPRLRYHESTPLFFEGPLCFHGGTTCASTLCVFSERTAMKTRYTSFHIWIREVDLWRKFAWLTREHVLLTVQGLSRWTVPPRPTEGLSCCIASPCVYEGLSSGFSMSESHPGQRPRGSSRENANQTEPESTTNMGSFATSSRSRCSREEERQCYLSDVLQSPCPFSQFPRLVFLLGANDRKFVSQRPCGPMTGIFPDPNSGSAYSRPCLLSNHPSVD